MSVLTKPYFHDEEAAIAKLEDILWPECPVCPHCGAMDRIYELKGKSTRPGLRKCGECRKQFTVKVGTVFESSHIPLFKWLQACFLMTSSKKGISAHQLHRTLEITYKSAWFMCHRLREAMRAGDLEPMGGFGRFVEADETFIGRDKNKKKRRGYAHKFKILSLVDRKTGEARSVVIDDMKADTIVPILRANIDKETSVMTDEAGHYRYLRKHFIDHDFVNHGAGEYGRGEVHSNTVEGYFSIFKRGMKGVYQHCGEKHLHRYLAEYDFRYSNREATGCNDSDRFEQALRGIVGKRLTYEGPDQSAHV